MLGRFQPPVATPGRWSVICPGNVANFSECIEYATGKKAGTANPNTSPIYNKHQTFNRLELAFKLRQHLEQVSHQPIVGYLKDRRVFILVDGNNHARILHAGQMLDRAGNPHGNV